MLFDRTNEKANKVEQVEIIGDGAPAVTIVDEKDLRGDYSGAAAKTDQREIALVRKLDLRIMPTLWAMYFLNYLDRNAIAQARLNDLEEDLNLHGTQYNTCISILFVG